MTRPLSLRRSVLMMIVIAGVCVAPVVPVRAAPDDSGTASADIASDVAAARGGLARFLEVNRPAAPEAFTEINGCPAIAREQFESALADTGFSDPLGDWGTTIEWEQFLAFDPTLLGIACRGDTDGEADDANFGLFGGLLIVDVGSDDRVADLYQHLAFGVLDVETADVPGGEISSLCVNDAGIGVCMAFWSFDGFVVGVNVWSSAEEVPEGTASTVLVTVLTTVIDTLGTYEPEEVVPAASTTMVPPDDSTPDDTTVVIDGIDVGGARAGLDRMIEATPDTDPMADLVPCRLMPADDLGTALAAEGVDTPIQRWSEQFGPYAERRALTCEGDYVGTGDPAFPELRIELVVVDFGKGASDVAFDHVNELLADVALGDERESVVGGTSVGACDEIDQTDTCIEFWTNDGFTIGLTIADRVTIDRTTTVNVLDRLVPDVLTMLAGNAELVGDPLLEISSSDVGAAAAGLVDHLAFGVEDCPAIAVDDVAIALDDAGVPMPLDGWAGAPMELESGSTTVPGMRCAGGAGSTEFSLTIIDFDDQVAADDFVASVALENGGSAADLPPDQPTVGSCVSADGIEFCTEWWRRDGLVIGVTITAPADELTRSDAGEVLVALVPLILDNLVTP